MKPTGIPVSVGMTIVVLGNTPLPSSGSLFLNDASHPKTGNAGWTWRCTSSCPRQAEVHFSCVRPVACLPYGYWGLLVAFQIPVGILAVEEVRWLGHQYPPLHKSNRRGIWRCSRNQVTLSDSHPRPEYLEQISAPSAHPRPSRLHSAYTPASPQPTDVHSHPNSTQPRGLHHRLRRDKLNLKLRGDRKESSTAPPQNASVLGEHPYPQTSGCFCPLRYVGMEYPHWEKVAIIVKIIIRFMDGVEPGLAAPVRTDEVSTPCNYSLSDPGISRWLKNVRLKIDESPSVS